MKSKTSGHLAVQGGIRGHSAGDIFPYIVMLKGMLNDLKYIVIGNGLTGTPEELMTFNDYDTAHGMAEAQIGYDMCVASIKARKGAV